MNTTNFLVNIPYKDLLEMKFHDRIVCLDCTITKVWGGWIYMFKGVNNNTTPIFVPLNVETQV